MRVLIAVTHLLGAGHLTRAAALARAFAGAGHDVVLLSGGAPAPMVRLDGVRLVQLQPVRIAGTDFATPLGPDGAPAHPDLLAHRCAQLIEADAAFSPEAIITELFPFGRRALAAEFLALVEAAHARSPRPLVLASVRDILVASAKPERIAQAHARLSALYDAVLVHGDPALVPLDASWPLDAAASGLIRYTGYVDEGTRPLPAARRSGIVAAAGSGPAGLELLRAAAEAARRRPELGWRILAGHGVPEPALADLSRDLPDGLVTRARPDYRSLLAGAALSVSQSGYNTATDLLVTGTPAVLVPFEAGGETEQRLRAERLAGRGLARVLAEADLHTESLLEAVDAQRTARLPAPHGIDLDGAGRSVQIVEDLLAGRRSLGRRPAAERSGLDVVRTALDAAASRGRAVPFLWRDDDAVTATPALDRLIGLADRHAVPLLLAAIPAGIEPALGQRLESASLVSVAVHGLAHRNHAAPCEKPAEFGAHRSLDALRADAAAGLRIARDRLSEAALMPIFVPPWNRLAPALTAVLPELGYGGLSAIPGPPVSGLRRFDATLDPIDWRGTRSLRNPEVLLHGLAETIAGGRPIGLLTHHLVHDAAIWRFVDELLTVLLKHPAVHALNFRRLFRPVPVDTGAAPSKSPGSQIARTG
ncbi:glycosyl transferase family 28 [Methylobacterium mesophilicum SR1.6/6]|uniref:Glycosyl transferase family 28 n=1 Tax=Methylobacterium mesophilicum SR1.6/6 TaxID=908290 RepID=A0A6B9FK93_9HYPH|nr:glycosyltransferase [Methylobacterium mesophilicum]QGY02797.1 glycosyl transferase family 28 [Methylobacterium mesophilicum SR1.6/6]